VTQTVSVRKPRARVLTPGLHRFFDALAMRMMLASAALALIVVGGFALLVDAMTDLRGAADREATAKEIAVSTLSLEKLVVDLETGLRGFTLTGDKRFLRPWSAARSQLPPQLQSFQRLTRSDPVLARQARELTNLLNVYVQDYSVPLVEIARDSPEAAASPDAVGEGRRRTEEIRRRFTALRSSVDAEARSSAEAAKSGSDLAIRLGITGLGASAVLIMLLALYLTHSIARPAGDVARRARRIARGDFGSRLPERGPGEIGHLTRSFNAMADELAKRRHELDEQNAQLRDSERMKSELISIVSHEVRTPLASMLGFTSVLLQRDVTAEEQRRYLGIIDTQGKRLQALLDDFLYVQRIEEGQLPLAHERFDLRSVVREQVDLYSGTANHPLKLHLPGAPLGVEGDPGRLAHVIGNLLSNALKYSPPGRQVDVSGEARGDVVRVTVRDRGSGIPPEQHAGIFTKFFRGGAADTGIPGTGLGLAFARAVVEAHGGQIAFRSAPGAGSTFWFDVPARPTAAPDG
jgi:signal transduction histidine kinase